MTTFFFLLFFFLPELLSKKPEQEKRLLSGLVNKLGDPDRKIGANVVFMLQQIIREHPGMKISIVKELEALMFRERVAERAQYYSVSDENICLFCFFFDFLTFVSP